MRLLLLLVSLWLAAAPEAPRAPVAPAPPRPPEALALPGFRLHLVVDEDVDPDRLRALARPEVVLWLRTRSNMVRSSVAETLGRFGEVYVQVRPPLLEAQATQLRFAPRAGLWVEDGQLGGAGLYRAGSRPLAVEVRGTLDAARAERVRRARPARITWSPPAAPDLEAWSVFAQLPGAKVLSLPGAARASWDGCAELWPRGAARATAVRVDLRGAGEPFALPTDCRLGARVRVDPRIGDEALARILAANPSAELELEVGSDEAALRGAAALLSRLAAASPGGARQAGRAP